MLCRSWHENFANFPEQRSFFPRLTACQHQPAEQRRATTPTAAATVGGNSANEPGRSIELQ